jgi:hypothetical protein
MRGLRSLALVGPAALLLAAGPAWAQKRLEIGGSYGYQFGGMIRTDEGNVRVPNGPNFGVSIDLAVRPNAWIEVSYSRQDTTVDLQPPGGGSMPLYDAAVEYYQVGGLYEKGGPVSLFGLATIGVFSLNPKTAGLETETWFAAAIGAGLKVPLSRRLGFRLQGRLLVPVLSAGGVVLIGPGGSTAVISSTVLVWGDLSAGFYLRF